MQDEETLLTVHPSMFRDHPAAFVLMALGSLVVIGLPFLIAWWLRVHHTTLVVTNKRTTLKQGILAKYTSEVLHAHVRNIQVSQTFGQRLMGVGSLAISSAGQADVEIRIEGVPDPEGIQATIDKYR
jgi:uncharacterized membrane protein YdbT with pleckstrin-like domain